MDGDGNLKTRGLWAGKIRKGQEGQSWPFIDDVARDVPLTEWSEETRVGEWPAAQLAGHPFLLYRGTG